ncbi:MAG: PLP-dependent aminotransferase family protein [Alphaproteobacteria bacterium]
MTQINLRRDNGQSLVQQIVAGIGQQIDEQMLRPGTRLPSIRDFASRHSVSRHTVVEAYDRLVAAGYLTSRRGAGFFTQTQSGQPRAPEPAPDYGRNEELVWLIRRLLDGHGDKVEVGGPWLPDAWLEEAGLRRTLRGLAQRPNANLLGYGEAAGYRPLCEHLVQSVLGVIGVSATAGQVVLTHGASQALDLIGRQLLRRGDKVLVEDPGYYNLFGSLRLQGLTLLAVPRGPDGPDLEALAALAEEHRPKLFFTQSVMQNPTGTSMSPNNAFRVLQLAERFQFLVVEDDVFSDLHVGAATRLATLDQLQRVIYVRSFSKTLSGSLRVGMIACRPDLAREFTVAKMLTAITTSPFVEQLIYQLLVEGHYRRYVSRLQQRVIEARAATVQGLEQLGLEVRDPHAAGMFLWARVPGIDDALPLAEGAIRDGLLLAPGTVFRPHLEPTPWMRFNVAVCAEPAVRRAIGAAIEGYRLAA